MDTQPKAKQKKDLRKIIVITVIIILVIANGLMVQKNIQTIKELDTAHMSLYISDSIKQALNEELVIIKKELDTYKGQSHPMDSMLLIVTKRLEEKQLEIERLLEENTRLSKLESKFNEFQRSKRILLARVDSLSIALRKAESKNTSLGQEIKVQKDYNEKLKAEQDALRERMEAGSVLRAEHVSAFGWREKSKGVYSKTTNVKKVKKIEVCFDIVENKVVGSGRKDVYLRMLNPKGSVIADEKFGSGKIIVQGSDEEIAYTIKYTIQYENIRQHLCMNWEQYYPFIPGDYKVELYSEGYKIGTTVFTLK